MTVLGVPNVLIVEGAAGEGRDKPVPMYVGGLFVESQGFHPLIVGALSWSLPDMPVSFRVKFPSPHCRGSELVRPGTPLTAGVCGKVSIPSLSGL